jgi:acetyl esterase/lipase
MAAPPPEEPKGGEWTIPLYVLHSRQDEIFPASETESVVTRMKEQGVPVELKLIDGVTHFDTEGFVEPLKGALPWIRKVWE